MDESQVHLTLSQYLDLLGDVPLPNRQQKEYFIEYVSHSHSWYKHLPTLPPGRPFYFYLDKYAAFDIRRMNDGSMQMSERSESGFHYAHMPTQEYRKHFGHLAFSSKAGTRVSFVNQTGSTIPRDKFVAIPNDNGEFVGLPSEILDVGEVHLTSVIHAHTASSFFGFVDIRDPIRENVEWSEQSGGRTMLERLIERWKKGCEWSDMVYIEDSGYPFHPCSDSQHVDPVMYDMLEPERNRLRDEMMNAIDRICDLVSLNKGE